MGDAEFSEVELDAEFSEVELDAEFSEVELDAAFSEVELDAEFAPVHQSYQETIFTAKFRRATKRRQMLFQSSAH